MQNKAFKNTAQVCWAFIKRIAVRVWEYLKVAKMEWIVLIGVFAFDLITKSIVENTVPVNGTVVVIPKFFNVHRIHNYAAAFGADFLKNWFGDMGARIFYSVFAVAASVAFVLVLIRQKGKSRWFRVALALFVAGAMGNCIDRMFLGYVRDFIEFVYFGLTIWGRTSWYVFNIADAALVAGVIMIVIYFIFMYKDKDGGKLEGASVDSSANATEDKQNGEAPADSDEKPDPQKEEENAEAENIEASAEPVETGETGETGETKQPETNENAPPSADEKETSPTDPPRPEADGGGEPAA